MNTCCICGAKGKNQWDGDFYCVRHNPIRVDQIILDVLSGRFRDVPKKGLCWWEVCEDVNLVVSRKTYTSYRLLGRLHRLRTLGFVMCHGGDFGNMYWRVV